MDATQEKAQTLKIMDILVKDAVILDLHADTKQGVLRELAESLAKGEPQLDVEDLIAVLAERERWQSTGIGDGVAIPHGRIKGLDRLLATFARSAKGVDFAAVDGAPTHLFFLLVVPENAGNQHLKALARISRFFRDKVFCARLLDAKDREELLCAITDEDARL